jgi:uncharacterized phage-like protein YoqJ
VSALEREKTCCFTGHRENKLPWRDDEGDTRCLALKKELGLALERAYLSGMRHFLCGMANGCDLYFAEAVLALREKLPDVTLEAAIPWEGQADGWTRAQRARYDAIRERCDYETVVSKSYTPDCLMRRNQYMVDCSALLIAAYSGASGGTRNTILYAMRRNLEIYEIMIDE